MALTAANVEKVTRLLIALEQRIFKGITIASVMDAGELSSTDLKMTLTNDQKASLSSAFSNGVASAEKVLAAIETKVLGSSTITPGPPGSGVTDWASVLTSFTAITTPESGVTFHQELLEALVRNMNTPRGDDGELTVEAAGPAFLSNTTEALKNRGAKMRLLLSQLRALGA